MRSDSGMSICMTTAGNRETHIVTDVRIVDSHDNQFTIMKASFDITFVPMTNVIADVNDPRNLSEEEQVQITNVAAKQIAENIGDKINYENLAEIRLYETDGKQPEERTVIFDNGCLRESSNPIEESLRLLTGLAQSGYIPFASPSPSSSEVKLRNCISSAISLLEIAQLLEKELGYRQ